MFKKPKDTTNLQAQYVNGAEQFFFKPNEILNGPRIVKPDSKTAQPNQSGRVVDRIAQITNGRVTR